MMRPIDEIRADFPALARRENDVPVAYFDGPGGTQVPRQVAEAVTDYLFHHNANTHWSYATSAETDAALLAAREALGDYLGGDPAGVAFGANMTTLTYHVSRALGREWGPGDEVVVTELDHEANIAPWEALVRERGIVIKRVPLDPETGTLDLAAFERLVGARTRLVAVGAASNALGTINDLERILAIARSAGALTYVDAVHFAAHAKVEAEALGCDFIVCSPYKFHGPHVGALWGRPALIEELDVPRLDPAGNESPERLETGTLNHEGIVGAAAAVDWIASLAGGEQGSRAERLRAAFEGLHARGAELFARGWAALSEVEGVRLYGPPPGAARTPTLAFTVGHVDSEQVAARLSVEHAVFVSHGDFYAPRVVAALGLERIGLVRAGCACTTTEDEIDRLVEGVRVIAAG